MPPMEPVPIRLRLKYRRSGGIKQNKARPRTGPRCCNSGCGRKHSKMAMAVMGRGKS